jgi:hypothetical protein
VVASIQCLRGPMLHIPVHDGCSLWYWACMVFHRLTNHPPKCRYKWKRPENNAQWPKYPVVSIGQRTLSPITRCGRRYFR